MHVIKHEIALLYNIYSYKQVILFFLKLFQCHLFSHFLLLCLVFTMKNGEKNMMVKKIKREDGKMEGELTKGASLPNPSHHDLSK